LWLNPQDIFLSFFESILKFIKILFVIVDILYVCELKNNPSWFKSLDFKDAKLNFLIPSCSSELSPNKNNDPYK
jgi:hypothetical protein